MPSVSSTVIIIFLWRREALQAPGRNCGKSHFGRRSRGATPGRSGERTFGVAPCCGPHRRSTSSAASIEKPQNSPQRYKDEEEAHKLCTSPAAFFLLLRVFVVNFALVAAQTCPSSEAMSPSRHDRALLRCRWPRA